MARERRDREQFVQLMARLWAIAEQHNDREFADALRDGPLTPRGADTCPLAALLLPDDVETMDLLQVDGQPLRRLPPPPALALTDPMRYDRRRLLDYVHHALEERAILRGDAEYAQALQACRRKIQEDATCPLHRILHEEPPALRPQTPRQPSLSRDAREPAALRGALPRKMLIADDNVPFREMIADYLAGYGCEVLQASNGLETLFQVKHARPEAILLDLAMPRVDGFETLKRLHAFDPTLRVVIVTGSIDAAAHAKALAAGAAAVLMKPVDFVELVRTLTGY